MKERLLHSEAFLVGVLVLGLLSLLFIAYVAAEGQLMVAVLSLGISSVFFLLFISFLYAVGWLIELVRRRPSSEVDLKNYQLVSDNISKSAEHASWSSV